MIIEKLNNSQIEKETAGYVKLFKNKATGELMYLTKTGQEVVFPTQEKVLSLISENAPTGGSDYTETIVNISSAQILAMGSNPVELLPAAGANSYYDIKQIVIEKSGTAYTLTDPYLYLNVINFTNISADILTNSGNRYCIVNTLINDISTGDVAAYSDNTFDTPVTITTWLNSDPTGGTGTLRVKIYHKTITFGA